MAARVPVDRNFLWSIFAKIDKDRNGSISADELQQALSNGTWTPFNPETVRLMIGMFDHDNSGAIEFNEFYALWQYVTDWQRTFRSYDQDNSGTIDRQELKTGYRLSENMYTILMTKFDRRSQGSINFDDFIQCCIILQMLTNSFRSRDYNQNGWITITYEDFLSMAFSLRTSK